MTRDIVNRTQVIAASGLAALAALWLLISPWALRYTGSNSAVSNDIVFAIIIGMLSTTRAFATFQAVSLGWLVSLLAIWVIISPWVLGFANRPVELWNNVATGGLIFLLAVWGALATVFSTPAALMSSVESEFHDRSQFQGPVA